MTYKSYKTNRIYRSFPETPGVYIFKDQKDRVLYIGKAVNLKRRVASYFQKTHDARVEKLVREIRKITCRKTDSALEALILEASLIKKHQPPWNIREKDDKSFLFVEFTKGKFSRVLLVRGKETEGGDRFGPFISAASIREALKILRRIFPWSVHNPALLTRPVARPCFEYQIGLCPGVCVNAISTGGYRKSIKKLKLFFRGKKGQIIKELEREMKTKSARLEFEEAQKIKRQIFALRHIEDTAIIKANQESGITHQGDVKRIEGYDISNISGASAVGAMVVFENRQPKKSDYRKFKIKTIPGSNDAAMLKEVITRRLNHGEWPLPDLILVDGGLGQVRAVKSTLTEKSSGASVPVLGIAKGPERKKNEFIGAIPPWTSEKTLIAVRDEAHRFAIAYHKNLRGKQSLGPLN